MLNYLRFARTHAPVLGFGVLLTFFASLGQTYFIAIFGGELRQDFGLSHGEYGGAYSLATLASGSLLIWLGRLLDSIDIRIYATTVALGLGFACLAMSLTQGLYTLTFAFFLLRMFGQGLMFHTGVTTMAKRFDKDRGKALSITTFGVPLGEVFFPFIGVIAVAYGWRFGWGIYSAVVIFGLAPLIWFWADKQLHNPPAAKQAAFDSGDVVERIHWNRGDVLRHRGFHFMLPGLLAPAFIVTGLFFHQVHIVESKGWPLSYFASFLAIFAGTALCSSILGGYLVDRYSAKRVLPFAPPFLALGSLSLMLFEHVIGLLVLMVLLGIAAGAQGTIGSALWPEVCGIRNLGAIRAMITSIMIFGSAVSPVLLGWLFDAGIDINYVALGCALYACVGGLLFLPGLRLLSLPKE